MKQLNLLIVDDEPNIRLGLKEGVDWQSAGINHVYSAEDGSEALALCEKKQIDIVISDIKMSGIDGMELGARLAVLYPEIKIILLSGYAEFDYARRAIKFGAAEYMLKPVKIPEILGCVKKLAEQINLEARARNEHEKQQRTNEIRDLLDSQGLKDKEMKNSEGLLKHESIFGKGSQDTGKPYSPMIILSLNYIYTHSHENITVDDVATFLKKSNNYFSSQFKKEMGLSFVEYLSRLRIEEAKVLLSQTTMMTYEIAERVGFNDYKYFSVVFRNTTGKSPSQYRRE